MYNWNSETLSTIKTALTQKKEVSVILHENIGCKICEHKITDARLCDTNPNEIEIQINSQSFIPITERDLIFVRN
jgi:hypothetical protein